MNMRHQAIAEGGGCQSARFLERYYVIDCFGILDDASICRYFERGCELNGHGMGAHRRDTEAHPSVYEVKEGS